jgi:hypothetical protein
MDKDNSVEVIAVAVEVMQMKAISTHIYIPCFLLFFPEIHTFWVVIGIIYGRKCLQ